MVRHIANPFVGSEKVEAEGAAKCTPEWLRENIAVIGRTVLQRPKDPDEWNDPAPYTGLSGIALALFKAAPIIGEEATKAANHDLTRALALRSSRAEKQARYLCGDLGAMTVQLTNRRDSKVEDQIRFLPRALLGPVFPCDEVLYGRAGFLAAALWLKHAHGVDVIAPSDVRSVIDEIVYRGREDRTNSSNPPLMWEWHGTDYLGAAHGVAGILHLILSFPELLSSDVRDASWRTAEWMAELQDETGNFPSSRKWAGRQKDEPLIHWCHGAPGVIPLLITMHKLQRQDKHMQAILRAGELIWREGLLKKGPGLCHGVSGNAYALLNIYRYTGDEKWLRRARCFAVLMMDESIRRHQRTPDSPFSLFEGWAGALHLLVDLLHPERAQYPLFPIRFGV